MRNASRPAVPASIVLALLLSPATTHAAESHDSCTGFIDSIPATIGTQGTWCLRSNVGTAMTSGAAITIAANNVTVDCNGFKIGGLAAGSNTTAFGIYAFDRLNATVRHCTIRGFRYGVALFGASGGGHVVEDNRLDHNTYIGVDVTGDGSVVRRNQVLDTGGTAHAYGIRTLYEVDVLDNTISGVLPGGSGSGNNSSYGIYTNANPNGSINGNRVRGLAFQGTGGVFGIYNNAPTRLVVRGNDIVNTSSASIGAGVMCANTDEDSVVHDNIILGFGLLTLVGCATYENPVGP